MPRIIAFKYRHVVRQVILWAVRWYVAYPISDSQPEEMMAEHDIDVDHATVDFLLTAKRDRKAALRF